MSLSNSSQHTNRFSEATLVGKIKKLETKLKQQELSNSPLKFFTGMNLYTTKARLSWSQHDYNKALDEYWESIKFAESRISELIEHSQEGMVGAFSSQDLINQTKKNISMSIKKIVSLQLTKSDITNQNIQEHIKRISAEIFPKIKKMTKVEVERSIETGVLAFARSNMYIILANQNNLDYIMDKNNFNLVYKESLYKYLATINQNAAKEIRKDGQKDVVIAKQCYNFRSKSAHYYKLLDDEQNYFAEISLAFLYKVYSSRSRNDFEKNYKKLEDILLDWESRDNVPMKELFYKRAFASIYGLRFLDPANVKERIKNLKIINHYLDQTGSKIVNLYKFYENFYTFLNQVQKAKKVQDIDLSERRKFYFPDTIQKEIEETKSRYNDIHKLLMCIKNKKIDEGIEDRNILSISQLYIVGAIDDKVALNITRRIINVFLGKEIVPMKMLDESDDERTIKEILKLGETSSVEVKKSFSDSGSIGIAISSFANTKGGKILIGLEEISKDSSFTKEDIICKDFAIIGIEGKVSIDDQKKRLTLALHNSDIDVEDLIIDTSLLVRGKRVGVIEVPNFSNIKPIFYQGEYYKRIDAQNKKLTHKEVLHRISQINVPAL